MSLSRFLRENAPWLAGAFSLTFFSSVGQTFFISLFAGEIRTAHGLGHGGFGLLYMVATLASALTLVGIGRVVDVRSTRWVASAVIVALAASAVLMAAATTLPVLLLALFCLRLFGQGMMSHTALTAMGRWFVAERGRAVAVTTTGFQLGEGALPILVASLLPLVPSWRVLWLAAAALLLLVALPFARRAFAVARVPSAADTARTDAARHWTRTEVLRDGPFWIIVAGVVAPPFIGTSVVFHQIHLGEIKGWSGTVVAGSFAVLSVTTAVVLLATGQLIDRIGARRLLPAFLGPLGLGCVVLASFSHPFAMVAFMFLLGLSMGTSNSVFGAIWPELYGTRHLGAVRSVVFAAMVFSSALGPGLTGSLIDAGVGLETQLLAMGLWCALALVAMVLVSRRLGRRELLPAT